MTELAELVFGFALLLLGAACGGSFGLPSKFVSKEVAWENLWGPFFLFATLLLPLLAGPMLIPGILRIYSSVGIQGLAIPFAFGVLWGLGSMTLGLSFAFIGLSLAYAINYGGQIIVGSMVPLLIHKPEKIATLPGILIVIGVIVCLLGVAVCGRAGVLKSLDDQEKASESSKSAQGMIRGLILALFSGVLCACWAIGFSFNENLQDVTVAEPFAIIDWRKTLPTTFLMLFGGFFSSCLYCAIKLNQNKSWKNFKKPKVMFAVVIALLMAFLHDAAVGLFGFGASKLGDLGVSVGYTVFMAFAIMIGNLNGFLTGEWKNAGKKAIRWIYAGILLLVVAVCILGTSNGLDTLNKQSETPPLPVPSTTEIDSGVTQEQVVQE